MNRSGRDNYFLLETLKLKTIMEIKINTESKAAAAIINIAHCTGLAETYTDTITRLFNAVLYNQDDLGMDDTEAIDTLRVLALLRDDIRDIAGDQGLAESIRALQKPAPEESEE